LIDPDAHAAVMKFLSGSFDAVSAREEGRRWFTQLAARGMGSFLNDGDH
jgi:hypothetical protein